MANEVLLSEIDAFLGRSDVQISETAFGKLAVNDGHFVADLREGRRVWPETADKIRRFIAERSPAKSTRRAAA